MAKTCRFASVGRTIHVTRFPASSGTVAAYRLTGRPDWFAAEAKTSVPAAALSSHQSAKVMLPVAVLPSV